MSNAISATNYPFKSCINGHSLEGEDAFIVIQNGNRMCRMCLRERQQGKVKSVEVRGAFDGGMA